MSDTELWMNTPAQWENPLCAKIWQHGRPIYIIYKKGLHRCEINRTLAYLTNRETGKDITAHLLLSPVNREEVEAQISSQTEIAIQKAKREYERKVAEIMEEEAKEKALLNDPLTITKAINIQEDSEELKWMFHPPY